MAASFIGNRIGRRPFLIFGSIVTLIGAAGQAGAVNLGMFIAFR
jgi:MFS family permease